MKQLTVGIVLLLLGGASIAYRNKLAQQTIDGQNRIFHFRLGKRNLKATERTNLICGLILIVLGILTITGKFHWQV